MRLDSTAANEKAAQIGETWAASFASEPAPRWRKRVFYLVDAPRVVKNRVARRPITVTHDAQLADKRFLNEVDKANGRRPSPVLQRVAFTTSRLAEFCSVPELTKRVGAPSDRWPLVVLKELCDNALDAAEEREIAPDIDIRVSVRDGSITVTDNGPGLSGEVVRSITDYTTRTSAREAYVSPSRGRQGNALQSIVAMAFALDGESGETLIESRREAHTIRFLMDRVRREPRIDVGTTSSLIQNGTSVTVRMPAKACVLLADVKAQFVHSAVTFAALNPHLSLRCQWDGDEIVNVEGAGACWRKWRTCDFTSAHWYDRVSFERYMAAHIARDQERGVTGRTVRDFIRELRGLRRPDVQKLVLEQTSSSPTTLEEYFARGPGAIDRLLTACQAFTEPVKPKALGVIGRDYLLDTCSALGAAPASFRYRRHLNTEDALPYAFEVAFAWCPEEVGRNLLTGVNFSIALSNPFHRLGHFQDLSSLLERQYAGYDEPVVIVVHYTCPKVEFSDHGKTMLMLPYDAGRQAAHLVEAVTKDWADQHRAEIRSARARANRREKLLKQTRQASKPAPPTPTGALAAKITQTAAMVEVKVDDLAVLRNDPYTAWRRRRDAEVFAKLFEQFVADGQRRHLRGLFYRCIMIPDTAAWPDGKPLINTYGNWVKFQRAAAAARWLGLVAFERIIDARNDEAKIYVPDAEPIETTISQGTDCKIPESADAVMPRFELHGFLGRQTHRLIFYGEKTSLAEVLEPIAEQIGAEMILVIGESSDTRLAEAIARAAVDGRPAVLFYFADFDPSGHQMTISVARKVQAQIDLKYPTLDIKIYRVALTVDQVRDWELPSKPLSAKEKRGDRWREAFGLEQTEIDAALELRPEELRLAVFDAIAPFYDATLNQCVRDAQERWEEESQKALEAHRDYADISTQIAGAFAKVEEAVAALREQQERAAEMLRSSLPSPPELPTAAPTGKAKTALFDSADDFVSATRRLISDKKLAPVEDNGDEENEQDEGRVTGEQCTARPQPPHQGGVKWPAA